MTDTERLDFYAANTTMVLNIGSTWYYRKSYGQPIRKSKDLRDAIDAAKKLKDDQNGN